MLPLVGFTWKPWRASRSQLLLQIYLLAVLSVVLLSPTTQIDTVTAPTFAAEALPVYTQTLQQKQTEQIIRERLALKVSAFDPEPYAFHDATKAASAVNEAAVSGAVPATAILVHWRRRKTLDVQLAHLATHPFIREIIVWNNNPSIKLSVYCFSYLQRCLLMLWTGQRPQSQLCGIFFAASPASTQLAVKSRRSSAVLSLLVGVLCYLLLSVG